MKNSVFIIHARHCIIADLNSTYIQLSIALDLMDQFDDDGKRVSSVVQINRVDIYFNDLEIMPKIFLK